ncbi:MAG TPA: TonB-dependent receptor [Anaeromyxobacter sp.]
MIELRSNAARAARALAVLWALASGGARAEAPTAGEATAPSSDAGAPAYEEGIVVEAPTRLPRRWTGVDPASVEVLDAKRLKASGARTIQDALQLLSGVQLSDQQGNAGLQDLSIRGLTASPVTGAPQGLSVFLDGVRVNEPAVEEVNLELVPLADVERIEIVHGPQAIFGRNTLGGAIHIVTRRGGARPGSEVEVEAGAGPYQQVKANVSGPVGPLDGYLAAGQAYDAGWRAGGASRGARVFGKVGLRTADTDATLSYQFQRDQLHEPGSLPLSLLREDRAQNYTPGDFFRPELHLVTLNAQRRLAPGLELAVNAFVRALDGEQFNASYFAPDTRLFNGTRTVGGTAQLDHHASLGPLRNQLAAGAEASRSSVRITVHQEPNGQFQTDPDTGLPLPRPSSDVSDAQIAAGAFVQDQLRVATGPLAGLAATAALRFDWIAHDIVDTSPGDAYGKGTGRGSYSGLVPAAGLRWAFASRWLASASYSGGFRAPAFLELTCADVTSPCIGLQSGVAPDTSFTLLRAVRARSLEAGLSTSPFDDVSVAVTAFRIDLHNDIFAVTLPDTTKVVFRNVGDTRREGLELKLRCAVGPLALEGSYAYTLSTFQSDVPQLATPLGGSENVPRGAELPMSPRHRAALGGRLRALSWLDLSAGLHYVGSQRYLGDEANVAPRLPAYAVLGAGAEARWRTWGAFVRATNLLDARYEVFGTFARNGRAAGGPVEPFLTPGAPLRVFAGLRWGLE